jgi:hypothetical protein
MSNIWFAILFFGALTLVSARQAVGRWRGHESIVQIKGMNNPGLVGRALNRQLGRAAVVAPFFSGSITVLALCKLGLNHFQNVVVRVPLYFLIGVSFVIFVVFIVLMCSEISGQVSQPS